MKHIFKPIIKGLWEAFSESDLINSSKHKLRETVVLHIRNLIVCVATILFLISLFHTDAFHLLRGIAYILGSIAYLCEVLLLTDCFSTKVPHRELFMIYCFAPLYILMGISYFIQN